RCHQTNLSRLVDRPNSQAENFLAKRRSHRFKVCHALLPSRRMEHSQRSRGNTASSPITPRRGEIGTDTESHPLDPPGEPIGEPIGPGLAWMQPYGGGRSTSSHLHCEHLARTGTDAPECFASRGSWVRVPSSPP